LIKIYSFFIMSKSFLGSWGIFFGLILGCIIGLVFNFLKINPQFAPFVYFITDNIFYPIGNLFLQSLFMIIVPLVFSSLVVGISDMKDPSSVGRLSKRLFLFYAGSTFIAIFIGQICMGTMKPGQGIPKEKAQQIAVKMQDKMSSMKEKSSMVGDSLWPGILTKIVPRNIIDQFGENNMLAVIFVSILFGLSLLYLPSSSGSSAPKESFIQFMSALSFMSVTIIKWIMKTAPVAVLALIAVSVSELGLDLLKSMVFYIFVMLLGLFLHFLGTYSLFLKFLVKIPIFEFFSRMLPIFSTAFSTSSSSATMPVTMRTLEKNFGAPRKIVSFSIPIGTLVNMDGTALFEVAATLFIAQIFGVELNFMDIGLLIAIVFITSVGIAGIPGGSLPILMSAIVILGIPAEGLAIILGVDRLLDMGRTVVNVTGDSIVTLYLSRKENVNINSYISENPI
ncbi:MAG: dicarboxylate/amino acid:cation symporter, partial [Bdellovibrionaceae bacterium]|nr:dicarboxylate/amino acid:cation symporter [Pseudobdellovibrionaceae bacterium]